MNNHRLLRGWLAALLLGGAVLATAGETRRVLTLEQLYEIAEARSVQLRPSLSEQEEARREISVARSARMPDIEASLALSYIGDGFTTRRDFSDYRRAPIPHLGNTLAITVNQPLYTGGAVTAGIRLAELKLTAARYAAELRRDDIRFRLTGFYLDIYKFANLRAVVANNIGCARKVLSEMRERYAQGVALLNDITRYELLVENLSLELIKIDNTLKILNSNLTVTAGLPEDMVVVPDSAILARALPQAAGGEERWQAEARGSSPRLMLARSGVDISRRAEDLVRAERLPKVGLKAGWTADGPILTEVPPINRNLSYWYVGVGVSYNLSSLFKTNRRLARSRAATRTAAANLDATAEEISLGVRADYVRYLEAFEELDTRRKSVELAGRNYHTVATRYAEGMALITDMLDAANSKLDAEQRLVNARIDIIYQYYKLLFITGKI